MTDKEKKAIRARLRKLKRDADAAQVVFNLDNARAADSREHLKRLEDEIAALQLKLPKYRARRK